MRMTVGYLLENAANRFADKIALSYERRDYTYSDLNSRVNRLANFMSERGVRKGDVVATLMKNSNFQIEVYWSCAKIGAIFAPLNCRLQKTELEHLILHSGAKTLIFGHEFSGAVEYLNDVCSINLLIQASGVLHPCSLNYEQILEGSSDTAPGASVSESDACQLLYTSGTTGKPKGVILSHGNVLWNVMNCLLTRRDSDKDVLLLVGPLYHAAGLNSHLTPKITVGAKVVVMKEFDSQNMMKLIEQHKVTVVSAAPSLYHILFESPDLERYDVSSVVSCSVGASICPTETKEDIVRFFPNIKGVLDVYGATEATCNISILDADDWLSKPQSVGKGLPFTRIRVVDGTGHDVSINQVGEIICKGPNIMAGYHRDPEETRRVLRDGWLHTGDLGMLDQDGYLSIVGRLKDIIISGGENIYPREVEEVLFAHSKIKEAAVIGVKHLKWGEAVKAMVVLKTGQKATEKEIIEYCKQHIASYKAPKLVDFLDEIPKTSSGKIDKKLLKSLDHLY
ncbi:MAG: long-chain-fatty-acid--CoA ligase [Deltaproteobacteria bacterium]|nr:long-chain-fatty-acid--CoA ligase [Deltaproteobacteria bacterium]